MTMNAMLVIFSLFVISSSFWFVTCASDTDFHEGVFTKENMQLNNMHAIHSKMAADDSRRMYVNGRDFFSRTSASRRTKRELNLQSYLSTRIGDLSSEFMFSLGSNRGIRNGQAMSFANNGGMKNGMISGTYNETPRNGMKFYDSTNTNMNERMRMSTGTNLQAYNNMGTSLLMNRNFNSAGGTPMNNGNIFRNGMGVPAENNREYHSWSEMSASNPEMPMRNVFNNKAENGMPMRSNTAWNPSANIGINGGASMEHSFGTDVNNNMKMSRGTSMSSGSNIMP